MAIDTSGRTASVSVYDQQVLGEITWAAGRSHSQYLLHTIGYVLELAGLKKSDLHAVAVASGPGSYSGLRVGATTAMGLGLGLGIGVVQVPTLEALARSVGPVSQPIRAAILVGRGHVASARFDPRQGGGSQAGGIINADLEATCRLASHEGASLIMDGAPSLRIEAGKLLRGTATLVLPALSCSRASLIAAVASERLAAGATPSAITNELVYVGS